MIGELVIGSKGAIASPLATALSGRKLDIGGQSDDVHPFQAISACWRDSARALDRMLGELIAMESHFGSSNQGDGEATLMAFRDLTYRATELFDVYLQLIPNRLKEGRAKADRKLIDEHVTACKRQRDPIAMLCNKFKHGNRQLFLTSAKSTLIGVYSFGYMVAKYKGGTHLVCDEDIHILPERSVSFRKKIHEIVHGLLRCELNTARLIGKLSDNSPITGHAPAIEFHIGEAIQMLTSTPVYTVSNEACRYDGMLVSDGKVILAKLHGAAIPEPTQRTTTIKADGVTTAYSFA